MDQLHAVCDKLFTEVDTLDRLVNVDHLSEVEIDLALSVAKRVRRDSNLAVRALARIRDATAQEGTST